MLQTQITSKDAPKIVAAGVAFIALLGIYFYKSGEAESRRENSAMIVRMNREMGVKPVEFGESEEEHHKAQKEETDREIASASGPEKSTR